VVGADGQVRQKEQCERGDNARPAGHRHTLAEEPEADKNRG
jgi:hypothetical protein